MSHSISYYLTIFVIKLKGIKRNFSENPVNYKKIRKEDIKKPKGTFFKQNATTFKISNSLITEIKQPKDSGNLLIFVHGGAFISGPSKHHWDSIKTIFNKTNHTIWMCDYPKAPESNVNEISENINEIYSKALDKYPNNKIILMGDSAGGTLITTLTQRLIKNGNKLPNKIILISPVMDASMTNPKIDSIEPTDPMLSKAGVLSAKKMYANGASLTHEKVSPFYGSFDNFPQTILFVAENDITFPDQQLAIEKLKKANVNTEIIIGEKMPHIWPLLPVMIEAKVALNKIIEVLNK